MTKQQIGTLRDVGRLLAFSASFVAGVACADTTWNNSAGGDMADPNNWSNGLPSSGTAACASAARRTASMFTSRTAQ